MGQRLIAMLGLLFVLVFGLLPGGLVVAVIVAAGAATGIPLAAWQLPILAAIAVVPLGVEAFALCHLGGRAWDRLDPSRELLEPAGG